MGWHNRELLFCLSRCVFDTVDPTHWLSCNHGDRYRAGTARPHPCQLCQSDVAAVSHPRHLGKHKEKEKEQLLTFPSHSQFGLGGTFCFASSVTLPSQWFYRNRGLATGTAISGGGVGGVAFSFLAQHLIATVGYRNALRIIGSMIFGILCIAVALARSRWRPPPSPSKGIGAFWDPSMATGNFALLLTYALLVTFSYLCPFFLTPSYTTYLGEDAQMGSKLLSVMCGMILPFFCEDGNDLTL